MWALATVPVGVCAQPDSHPSISMAATCRQNLMGALLAWVVLPGKQMGFMEELRFKESPGHDTIIAPVGVERKTYRSA